MEGMPHSDNEIRKITIPKVQKYLFFALLFILPLAIMPFSWDWTERAMSLVILSFSALILGLEVLRMFIEGKVSILKSSLDVGIFALVLSFLLSTIFSKDINTSLWGIDGRLGGGLIILLSLVLLSFSVRLFLKDERDIKAAITAFLLGMLVNNVLSLLSFLGLNIWGFLPIYKDLHQTGLPLFRSSKLHLLVNTIGILMSFAIIGAHTIKKSEKTAFIIAVVSLIFAVINIWVYSINLGASIVISLLLLLALLAYLLYKKLKYPASDTRNIFLFLVGVFLAILVPFILLQIPAVRNLIIPKSINIVAQVSLGLDLSWSVASSVFVNSFSNGLFGFGPDTYSIAYNLFKPVNASLLAFNNVNFYYSGNEILTQFANGGLFWFGCWILFGFLLVKSVFSDFSKIKQYGSSDASWYLVIINFILVLIYLSSLFTPFFVITTFLLLVSIAFRCVLRDILNKGTADKFVLKLWTANLDTESGDGRNFKNLNVLITIVISVISLGVFSMWISKGIASFYTLKAEAYFVEQNKKYEGDVYPTMEEREEFTSLMSKYYGKAVEFDKDNTFFNRKKGLMYLEKIGIAAEKYSKLGESDDKEGIIKDVGMWKNYTIDSVRKSIDLSPSVYANWEASTRVYMGLVGMGFYDYVADALYSIDKAIETNPSNYELYYSKAQIYVIKSEKDSALASLTKALSINPQHIPSILLAGDLNKEKGNQDVYVSYLKAAKKILEVQGNTNLEIYNEISKQLNATTTEEKEDTTQEETKSGE
ncbi:MAG: tetratricopeptide repeat protein [Candidatus Dojkabacteria bacterium]